MNGGLKAGGPRCSASALAADARVECPDDADLPRVLRKLESLSAELVELAFRMDCRGHPAAAEVAILAASRMREFCDELSATE